MRRLGYSPQKLIESARHVSLVFDWSDASAQDAAAPVPIPDPASPTPSSSASTPGGVLAYERAPEETKWSDEEELVCFPTMDTHGADEDSAKVLAVLKAKVTDALSIGMTDDGAIELWKLLHQYADCFRLHLGRDPPVDMPPLEVRLKPDAVPVRCKSRRYPAEQREFMRKHVEELRAAGMCFRNPKSAWCSPPLVVKKQEAGALRMTVDVRAVNAQTERLVCRGVSLARFLQRILAIPTVQVEPRAVLVSHR